MTAFHAVAMLSGLVLAPLLPGVINRTKAAFAGRSGQPVLQLYHDLIKLLRKGAVYSRTTTWVFRAAPAAGLACVSGALAFMPAASAPALASFGGDIVLVVYFLGLMRFLTVLSALDTGSSFEGMGASREVQFSALAEPALFVAVATLARVSGSESFAGLFAGLTPAAWMAYGPAFMVVLTVLFLVFLVENARIPVDDPNTHLELTMIHEVMILDYSGPDLAFVLYAASLKLWLLGAVIVNLAMSAAGVTGSLAFVGFLAAMMLLAIVVGVVESTMARLSLLKVPRMLVGAVALALLAFALAGRLSP
ncbi:MAG: hydrogenase [Lentisphaerae bacterium]|nr:hydrogenase [Lentisphaerota bacterium]